MSKGLVYLLCCLIILSTAGAAWGDLVGWWKLDEGSGTKVTDSSGNEITGNFVGTPMWATGKFGGALQLDGKSWVDFGNPPKTLMTGTKPMSIALWINPSNLGTTLGPSFHDDRAFLSRNQDWAFKASGRHARFTTPGVLDHDGMNTVLKTNEWQHVVVTFQPNTTGGCVFYLNGAETDRLNASRYNTAAATAGAVPNGGPVLLGNNQWTTTAINQCYFGLYDDVRLYDNALTAQQVQDLATAGASPGSPNPPRTSGPQGSLVAWGSNAFGQTNGPAGNDFIAIAAGSYYNLALRADGSIVGWGKNEHGQATPPAGKGFTAIAAGNYHSLALKADGSIVGWGGNDYEESTPPEGTGFSAIAAGDCFSLALKADGTLVGWGLNDRGQSSCPGGNTYIAIAAGRVQSAALRANGTIIVWGCTGWWYEGGLFVFYGRSPTDADFLAVGVGSTHGLGLKRDGSVEVWGYIDTYPPALKGLTTIAAGSDHDLALRADGSIIAWSRNSSGQATPPPGTGFIAIAGGREHSLAIKRE